MYGDFMLLDEAGKLEKGKRVYLGDVKGKDEVWLRDTLFENPEIIPVHDIDSTFGPLVPLCKELRTEAGQIDAVRDWSYGTLILRAYSPARQRISLHRVKAKLRTPLRPRLIFNIRPRLMA